MTTNVEQCDDPLAALLGPRTEGYIDFPLPDDHDRQIGAVVDEVARVNNAVSSAVRSHLTIDHAYILQAYARRMAIYAVRTHSVSPLKQALVALALAQPASDFRELIVEFTIIDHSAQLVGTTLDDLA